MRHIKKIEILLLILFVIHLNIKAQFWTINKHLISRVTAHPSGCGKHCESKVQVKNNRPTDNCNYSGQYDIWYPVVIENFNFKKDIPNEWMFNKEGGIDDEGNVHCNGGSYYGSGLFAYNNGNFDVSNGIAYLKVKKEWIPAGQNSSCPDKPYHFINSVLYSEFNIKQDVQTNKI